MIDQRPDLVIFDCDGVIVDSEPITDRVLAASLTRYGWPQTPHQVGALFVGGTISAIDDHARRQGADLPADWIDEVYQEMFDALAETPAIDGAIDLLDALDAAGLPYCIGSNGPHAKMDVTLKSIGVIDRFEGRRFSRSDVPAPKPAPDLFLHAARTLGAVPARCVVVGDTLNDAKAARAALIPCFGYAATATTPEAFRAHGAHPFTSMTELPTLLHL